MDFAECKAVEQAEPGTFDSVAVLVAILDATGANCEPPNPRGQWVTFLIEQGEIVVVDGRPTLPHWRALQEEGLSTPRVDRHRGRPDPAMKRPMKRASNSDETLHPAAMKRPMKRASNSDETSHETGKQPLARARDREDSSLRSEESTSHEVLDDSETSSLRQEVESEVTLSPKPARAKGEPSKRRTNGGGEPSTDDLSMLLTRQQSAAWRTPDIAQPKYEPAKRAWLGLGLRLPPTEKQRAIWDDALIDPDPDPPEMERLGRWIAESSATRSEDAVAYVLDRLNELRRGVTAREATAAAEKRAELEGPAGPIVSAFLKSAPPPDDVDDLFGSVAPSLARVVTR